MTCCGISLRVINGALQFVMEVQLEGIFYIVLISVAVALYLQCTSVWLMGRQSCGREGGVKLLNDSSPHSLSI